MSDHELVEALKALAHPLRLRIMQVLSGRERNVGEIEDAAAISQPTLSQQLAVLRNVGLVRTRKDAKLVYYRIDDDVLTNIVAATAELSKASTALAPPPRLPAAGVANFARLG